MEKFGPVKYAVLCKSALKGKDGEGEETIDNEQAIAANKGTGFVQFKT
jgi:hypothetical protein